MAHGKTPERTGRKIERDVRGSTSMLPVACDGDLTAAADCRT